MRLPCTAVWVPESVADVPMRTPAPPLASMVLPAPEPLPPIVSLTALSPANTPAPLFPSVGGPPAGAPIVFPSTTLLIPAPCPSMCTPSPAWPEIMLRAAGVIPPIVLLLLPAQVPSSQEAPRETPSPALPRAAVPAPLVPIRSPAMTLRSDATRSIPSPLLPLTRFPSPVAPPPIMLSLPPVRGACWQKPVPLSTSLRDPMPSTRLPNALVPVTSVPMVLPCTMLWLETKLMPSPPLALIRFPAPGEGPPMVLPSPQETMPSVPLMGWPRKSAEGCRPLPRGARPAAFVPILLPCTVSPPWSTTPVSPLALITLLRITTPDDCASMPWLRFLSAARPVASVPIRLPATVLAAPSSTPSPKLPLMTLPEAKVPPPSRLPALSSTAPVASASLARPDAVVPIRLRSTMVPEPDSTSTPKPSQSPFAQLLLPLSTLVAAGLRPPMTSLPTGPFAATTSTAVNWLGPGVRPSGSTPIMSPATTSPVPRRLRPAPPLCCPGFGPQVKQTANPVTERPFTVSLAPVTTMPSIPFPARAPSSRTVMTALSPLLIGRESVVAPGWDPPSMTVRLAFSAGSARRGWIVHTAGVPAQPGALAGI